MLRAEVLLKGLKDTEAGIESLNSLTKKLFFLVDHISNYKLPQRVLLQHLTSATGQIRGEAPRGGQAAPERIGRRSEGAPAGEGREEEARGGGALQGLLPEEESEGG